MKKALAILIACTAACSVETERFVVPEPPTRDLQPAIVAQLDAARLRALRTPDDPDALGRYAMVLHAYEFYEPAAVLYQRVRHLQPGAFSPAYLHGHTLLALGKTQESVQAYQTATAMNPKIGNTALGIALLDNGDLPGARKAFERALDFNNTNSRALYELSRLEAAEGNLAQATRYLQRIENMESMPAQVFYVLADIARRQGDSDAAGQFLKQFEQAKNRSSAWFDPLISQVTALRRSDQHLIDEAQQAIDSGDFRRAIELNESARTLNPSNPLPAAALVSLYARVGNNEKSDQALEIARQLDPDSAQLHFNIGMARIEQRRWDEAESAFLQVSRIDPNGSFAWIRLGQLYASQKKDEEAIAAFEYAYERAPTNDAVRLRLGALYVGAGQLEASFAVLQAATDIDAVEAQRLLTLGRAHHLQGNIEKARHLWVEAESVATRANQSRLAASARSEIERLDDTASN